MTMVNNYGFVIFIVIVERTMAMLGYDMSSLMVHRYRHGHRSLTHSKSKP